MSKIEALTDIVNLASETTAVQAINENSNKIETALTNTLSRDGSTPNSMGANLDLGSYRIINLAAAVDDNDAVRKAEFDDSIGGLTADVLADIAAAPAAAASAVAAAADAAASAVLASAYIGAATSAAKWTTARTITTTGDATGVSGAWDGSANISFALTIPGGTVTSAKMASGAAVTNIGYTPADLAGATFSGEVRLNYTPTSLSSDSAGFRGLPYISADNTITLSMYQSGGMLYHTSGSAHTWTVPPNSSVAFPLGTAIALRNTGAGVVTIAQGSGVTVRLPGTASSGNKDLSQWGFASLIKEGTDSWILTGSGLS